MNARRCQLAGVLVAVVLSVGTVAWAETVGEDTRHQARQSYEAGSAAFSAGRFAQALEELQRSYDLFPSLRTLYSIGLCQFELRQHPRARGSLAQYLRDGGEAVPAPLRTRATEVIAQIDRELVRLQVRVNVAGAAVLVDAVSVGTSPLSAPVELGPGDHVIEARLRGFEPAIRRMSLAPGARQNLLLELEPTGTPAVALRPIDRATVRIISVLGARVEHAAVGPGSQRQIAVPQVAHGSGLIVDSQGHILTAAHVVDGADLIIVAFPGQEEGHPAWVVARHESRDLAVLRLAAEPPAQVPLPLQPPTLTASDRISVSGYPLEVGERYPAATSGEVARARTDGSLQLSISLNPGNSGGPVINEAGEVIGIVRSRGDPTRGVLGLVMAEPISAALELLAPASVRPLPESFPSTGEVEVARLLSFILTEDRRQIRRVELDVSLWEQLVTGRERPAVVALLAYLAFDILLGHLASEGVAHETALPEPGRGEAIRLRAVATRLAQRAMAVEGVARRYVDLPLVAGTSAGAAAPGSPCGVVGTPCCADAAGSSRCSAGLTCDGGRCVGGGGCACDDECPEGTVCVRTYPRTCMPGRRAAVFTMALVGGLAMDDHERARPVEGGQAGINLLWDVVPHGRLAPVRGNVVFGLDSVFGGWRGNGTVALLLDLGYRVTLGRPRVSFTAALLYQLGYVHAEDRNAFSYLGYRVLAGLNVRRVGFGLTYRENSRHADTPLRALKLYLDWRI